MVYKWSVETKTHMRKYFKEEMEVNPDTILEKLITNKSWLCKKLWSIKTLFEKWKLGNPHLVCKENRNYKDVWFLAGT